MNQISNLYLNHLINKAYTEANANENAVCAVTKVNSPVRNQAIMAAANATVMVELYGAQKVVGLTYFNVWD